MREGKKWEKGLDNNGNIEGFPFTGCPEVPVVPGGARGGEPALGKAADRVDVMGSM